jgi:hypothetical protein
LKGFDADRKVFGLGLSKTGTSSLTEALNLLGIPAVHYPHDERTYQELLAGHYRLSILEEFQAASDIPVAPFYAQLDRAFPGSKFVLTVREREAWLRSCEVHWRLMDEWLDNFPDFKRFHEFACAASYGTLQFERERFSRAYEEHERNVRDYFRQRPGDLLVLDICGGEGWEKLCPFLELDAPPVAFPHANEWMHLLLEASGDVAEVIPEGETFILVDEEGFGGDFARGRTTLPFTEREGAYWGAPSDGETAVRELERMRQERGASFIAFGWPSFWWLEHYTELAAHLRTHYDCVLENRRLVVFDLRARETRGERLPAPKSKQRTELTLNDS